MTGRTNYTGVDNNAAMQGPAQITGVYEHFDALLGETKPTPEDLPSAGNWPGRTIFVQSVSQSFTWSGSIWIRNRPPFASASGMANSGTTGGGSISPVFWSSGVSVTFPVGLFTVTPIVTVSAQSAGIVWAQVEWATPTGAALKAMRLGSAPNGERINWNAVQQTLASAAG